MMRDDQICHCYAYDFQDPLVDNKYDREYNSNSVYEDDSSAAFDAHVARRDAVQPGRVTTSTLWQASGVDDESTLPLTAACSLLAERSFSHRENGTTSFISGSGYRTPMVPATRCNRSLSLISVGSSLSVQ